MYDIGLGVPHVQEPFRRRPQTFHPTPPAASSAEAGRHSSTAGYRRRSDRPAERSTATSRRGRIALLSNGGEPSTTGNWGWVGGALTGAAAILTAIWHRATRKPPPQRIPTQNAAELFERVGYLEIQVTSLEQSQNRSWAAIEGIRGDVSAIKREMISRDDLEQAKRDLLRQIAKMLENRA